MNASEAKNAAIVVIPLPIQSKIKTAPPAYAR